MFRIFVKTFKSMVKKFYRVGNPETNQGLWYDYDGKFTGLIHNHFNFCRASALPMPYDETVVGWLSTTDTIENLFHWFNVEEIQKLEKHGYYLCIFEAEDYREYENHWLINQKTSVLIDRVPIDSMLSVLNNS